MINLCSESSVRWHTANTLDSMGITNRSLKSILMAGVSSKLEPHVAKSLDQLRAQIRVLKNGDLSSQKDEEFLVLENEDREFQGLEDGSYAEVRVSELMQQIQSSEDWFLVARVSEHLQKTVGYVQLVDFIENLKPYLLDLKEHSYDDLRKTHFRSEYIYEIIWQCAQNITYTKFL